MAKKDTANNGSDANQQEVETVTEQGAQGQPSTNMDAGEFKNLRQAADEIVLRDAPLGQLLHRIIGHLGHAFGLDAAEEDAKEQARIDEAAQHLQDENAPVLNDAGTRTLVNPSTSVVPGTPDADSNPLVLQQKKEEQGVDSNADQNSEDKK